MHLQESHFGRTIFIAAPDSQAEGTDKLVLFQYSPLPSLDLPPSSFPLRLDCTGPDLPLDDWTQQDEGFLPLFDTQASIQLHHTPLVRLSGQPDGSKSTFDTALTLPAHRCRLQIHQSWSVPSRSPLPHANDLG
jgi:hypothetical protein